MLIVAALGGNALLQRGQPMTAAIQRSNARTAASALAQIAQAGHKLVVTHGNGPQVGLLALQQAAYRAGDPYPLDILDAGTEGMIGYLIEQELENALGHRTPVATLLTQVEVDPRDPAFRNPVKFIGPLYGEAEARAIAGQQGWAVARDGDGWRRVVASPEPVNIPDLGVLRLLLDHGVIVICTGGGGIPVAKRRDGALVGVEAVIDKDRASAFLATELGADALLMLTDVDAVYRGWGGPDAEPARLRRWTCPKGRWGQRSNPPAGSSWRAAPWPASARWRTRRRSCAGKQGLSFAPGLQRRGPYELRAQTELRFLNHKSLFFDFSYISIC
jgi:carbamate kinase